MRIVLFYAGLGKRGGISPDLWHLADALGEENIPVTVASKFREALISKPGANTVVNVYGCLPSLKNISVMLMARLKGQRLVWTPVFHPRRHSTWKGAGPYRIMALFDKIAPHLARITHGVSAATDEEASYFSDMGAPRSEVIPLVVNEVHHRLEDSHRLDARKRLGVGDEPLILIIAAHSPRRKGMDFASEVLTDLRQELPSVMFLVVGGGDLGALGGQAGVNAVGWCSDDTLLDAYRSADLLFVPSLYEQFSRATIEAWACELPVVLSDGVALAPLAERSGAGKVIAYRDVPTAVKTLVDALCDSGWRLQAGYRGRELVQQRFLRTSHLQATLQLYRSII
jgi:glycosyltransferase involved in cell wall biosynthesis